MNWATFLKFFRGVVGTFWQSDQWRGHTVAESGHIRGRWSRECSLVFALSCSHFEGPQKLAANSVSFCASDAGALDG